MPLFHILAGKAPLILTKDCDRIVTYSLTPAANRSLHESGVRHGRPVPSCF